MKKKIAVLVFPGTNSENETLRLLVDCGARAELVMWTQTSHLDDYDAFVLPGGFAYEDRVRAGAIAAHDTMMDAVVSGAGKGKLVLGVCNGAQILLEAGLAPGTSTDRKPTAAFTRNAQAHFVCERTWIKLAIDPQRSPITAALEAAMLLPAWVAHGEGRLAADAAHLQQVERDGLVAFHYAHADGSVDADAVPNGSALHAAGVMNAHGNVVALMPHPERDAWTFNHPDRRGHSSMLQPSGGAAFFKSFVQGVERS